LEESMSALGLRQAQGEGLGWTLILNLSSVGRLGMRKHHIFIQSLSSVGRLGMRKHHIASS
jgi:hypothetical protein